MGSEIASAPTVFSDAVVGDHTAKLAPLGLGKATSIFTIARGSSDAVANILSYEMKQQLHIPVTSLPPSTFSVFGGVDMAGAAGLVISQSGASDDLVQAARGIGKSGGKVLAITNEPGSLVEQVSDAVIPVNAGPEIAVPATKTVIGSIGAGMALLRSIVPAYQESCATAAAAMSTLDGQQLFDAADIQSALQSAEHVYVVGRGAGFGAAIEVALKIKETCAIHAEAYSASEVLHGPLQLASKSLLVIMLDTEEAETQESLDKAEARFTAQGCDVRRIRVRDAGGTSASPAATSAMLLYLIYPIIQAVALELGLDPDRPSTLSKVTRTT